MGTISKQIVNFIKEKYPKNKLNYRVNKDVYDDYNLIEIILRSVKVGDVAPNTALLFIITRLDNLSEYKNFIDIDNKQLEKEIQNLHTSLCRKYNISISSFTGDTTVREIVSMVLDALKPNLEIVPPRDRQFVFVGDEFDKTNQIQWADYNNLPSAFEFRNLQRNTLCVLHPLNDKVYIPYEGSDVFLLNEKVHDFIMFAAALGAKKVKAYAQVRHSNKSNYSSSSSTSGSADCMFGSASGSYDSSSTNYEALAMSSTFNFEREFSGNERLDVLDRIPWYKYESIWHQLKDERELFGTKSFKESISTSSMRTINNSNREAIKADLKLLFANVSGSYESTINSMVETQDDLIETIEVEF